jgi:hypothetical protein
MPTALHVATLCLTTIVLSTTLTHVLEWPGKMRLDRGAYTATQSIYYPGFTIAGFAEILAIIAAAALLAVAPRSGPALWLEVTALASLLVAHATYWLMTHPVNRFWLKDQDLAALGRGFFSVGAPATGLTGASGQDQLWRRCRDRWELSHAIRAVFAALAFISLVIALTLRA